MDIAVDLGSDRTRVFIENKGIVLDEASVVAFDVDTYDIVGVGNEAYKMIGKTPAGIRQCTRLMTVLFHAPNLLRIWFQFL